MPHLHLFSALLLPLAANSSHNMAEAFASVVSSTVRTHHRLVLLQPMSLTNICDATKSRNPRGSILNAVNSKDRSRNQGFEKAVNFDAPNDRTRRLASAAVSALLLTALRVDVASAKCADIESCREIGERKIEVDAVLNPTTSLSSGVRYKVLRTPIASANEEEAVVKSGSTVDLIYSIAGRGAYMYSKGFGFEKVDFGGSRVSDLNLDSLRVTVGKRDVPLGIEQALVGMRRGERRRVELPPAVGFETSDWKPAPESQRGKSSIEGYKRILEGRGTNQPPFPAATIWDIEVLAIRK